MIKDSEQKAFDNIFNDMIGNNIQFTSPIEDANNNLMKKFLIYADFTASGKGLRKIEDFIKYQVLPTYANVHSTVAHCAEITSKYLSEAKEYLRVYTNAKGNYSIIFHGQGATGGAHKLIEILSIKKYVSFYRDLKTAFEIGFIIYIPFIVLDLVVANILLALGMFMLSPQIVSTPFKLLIFIAVDGWSLIVKGLVESFN